MNERCLEYVNIYEFLVTNECANFFQFIFRGFLFNNNNNNNNY